MKQVAECWRTAAAEAMRKAGDLQGLIDELENPDETAYESQGETFHLAVRSEAVRELGRLGDPRAVSSVAKLLDDPHFSVRVFAAIALGDIGDRAACEPLMAALEDEDFNVRYRAAQSLGKIGDRSATDELCEALRDSAPGVRVSAARALARMGVPAASGPLRDAIAAEAFRFRRPITCVHLVTALLSLWGRRAVKLRSSADGS